MVEYLTADETKEIEGTDKNGGEDRASRSQKARNHIVEGYIKTTEERMNESGPLPKVQQNYFHIKMSHRKQSRENPVL